jgi:REP element-mobilizing transposase RayT
MVDPPYVLEDTARTIARDAIVAYCEEKNWTLLALHVRTNHVHLVLSAERELGRLMSDLKARASRELNRSGTDSNAKRWTRHGSTRHLFDDAAVDAAVAYTLDEQGPAMAVFDSRSHEKPPEGARTE